MILRDVLYEAAAKQKNLSLLVCALQSELGSDEEMPSMHRVVGPFVFDTGSFYLAIQNDKFEVSMTGRPIESGDKHRINYTVNSTEIKSGHVRKSMKHVDDEHITLKQAIRFLYDVMKERMQEVEDG